MEARCWLSLGDLERAERALGSRHQGAQILALVDLVADRPERALVRLSSAVNAAASQGAELRRLALVARAQLQLGNEHTAMTMVRCALDLARPEGYIRPFVDHAAQLLPVLQRIAARYPDAHLMKVSEHAERAISLPQTGPSVEEPTPLSAREQEILCTSPVIDPWVRSPTSSTCLSTRSRAMSAPFIESWDSVTFGKRLSWPGLRKLVKRQSLCFPLMGRR